MAKLPDDLTILSHEALKALTQCEDSGIIKQAERELFRRYENRPVGSKSSKFVASIKATVYICVDAEEIEKAKELAAMELDSKKNNSGAIELISPDPRILDVSIVLDNDLNIRLADS